MIDIKLAGDHAASQEEKVGVSAATVKRAPSSWKAEKSRQPFFVEITKKTMWTGISKIKRYGLCHRLTCFMTLTKRPVFLADGN